MEVVGQLTLLSPNGGEILRAGTPVTLSWEVEGVGENLLPELLRGDDLVGVIASGISPATTSHTWRTGRPGGRKLLPGQRAADPPADGRRPAEHHQRPLRPLNGTSVT